MSKLIVAALLIVTGASAVAGKPSPPASSSLDPRFDGKWIGIETFVHNNAMESWAGKTPQMQAIIVIAESGTKVGFVSGFAPGRYIISPKSKGNTILFDSARRKAKLTLSPDGNTIKEDGAAAIYARGGRGNVLCDVTATFRRMGK